MEDNPEMRWCAWLSWAAVVGPGADRKPNTIPPPPPPLFVVDTGFKLDGFEASGWLFSLIRAISLKPLVKFPLQEEQVLVWIEASLAVMAVTTTRLSTFTCWMSQWDWLSHSLSQEQKTINILGMFLAISAELTWPHVRPHWTFGSRARRAAESFQGCVKDLFRPFPVNRKSFCCLHFKKRYGLVNAKSTLKIT